MLRRAVTGVASAFLFALAASVAGGCELVVPDTVPAFACTGTAADNCPDSQICAPTLGKCVDRAQSCTIVSSACGPGEVCDPGTQMCVAEGADASAGDTSVPDGSSPPDASTPIDGAVDAPPLPDSSKCTGVGCPCTRNGDCDSNICGDSTILTGVVSGKVCTQACCASEECGAGYVCFAPGTGGNYCVAESDLGRTATDGTVSGGGACTTDAQCRSGLCGDTHTCADACCSDTNCAAGSQCALDTETGHSVLQCTVITPGTKGNGSTCTSNDSCHGGACEPDPDPESFDSICMAPCCGSTACGSSEACFDVQVMAPDWIPACSPPESPDTVGTGKLGDNCQSNDDCRSIHCEGGMCTDVCCSDADCAAMPGWVCQPTLETNGTFLRCGPVQ